MSVSLVMMVAALTYCMCSLVNFKDNLPSPIFSFLQSVRRPCYLRYVVRHSTSMHAVYKLVRFYEPSSRAAYNATRATLTVFSAFLCIFLSYIVNQTHRHVAIIAFLLLLGTFGVGIRCFHDFDRGLQSSKVNCQHSFFFLLSGLILKFKLSRSIPTQTHQAKVISKPIRGCERGR